MHLAQTCGSLGLASYLWVLMRLGSSGGEGRGRGRGGGFGSKAASERGEGDTKVAGAPREGV